MSYYRINCGFLAVDNGAVNPLPTLISLAEMTNQKVIWGEGWGQDYLRVPKDEGERKALEELLTDSKLIWEVVEKLPYNIAWQEDY